MAIAPNVTFVSGAILTAAQQNAFGFGIVGLATVNANYAPTSTASDFASVTFTAIANRYYKYSLIVPGADSDASRTLTIQLVDSANTAVNSGSQTLRGAGLLDLLSFTTIRTETAGSLTRKIRMTMSGGNASMCSATAIGYFLVEDIGPA